MQRRQAVRARGQPQRRALQGHQPADHLGGRRQRGQRRPARTSATTSGTGTGGIVVVGCRDGGAGGRGGGSGGAVGGGEEGGAVAVGEEGRVLAGELGDCGLGLM